MNPGRTRDLGSDRARRQRPLHNPLVLPPRPTPPTLRRRSLQPVAVAEHVGTGSQAVIQALNQGLESCATNSPTMSGPPSSQCCRTSRAAYHGCPFDSEVRHRGCRQYGRTSESGCWRVRRGAPDLKSSDCTRRPPGAGAARYRPPGTSRASALPRPGSPPPPRAPACWTRRAPGPRCRPGRSRARR
jgi:hypothetical protein